MRQTLSISLPKEVVEDLKNTVKKRGLVSVSDYLKQLIMEDRDLISVEELLQDIKSADKEYKSGKMVTADSLADLL